MKLSGDIGELARTGTVTSTGNYPRTSPLHQLWPVTSQEPAVIVSADKDKHAQTVKCIHRKLKRRVHKSSPMPPLRHWRWLTIRPAISGRWNRDSHTHMKQPCSFVNRGTCSSRQCMLCRCVRMRSMCLCEWAAAPRSLGNYRSLALNLSYISHPFSDTCVHPSRFFQHLCDCDRRDREGY